MTSWQGVNDLSARPAASGPNSTGPNSGTWGRQAQQTIVLNSLGDLTNRENRFAYSRFANDFLSVSVNPQNTPPVTYSANPDGIADDVNGDNVPDYYPTLYPGVFPSSAGGLNKGPVDINGNPIQLIYEPNYNNFVRGNLGLMGFPFVFQGAYSVPQQVTSDKYGWIHSPSPYAFYTSAGVCNLIRFEDDPIDYLQNLNHNPLDVGDNLPTVGNTINVQVPNGAKGARPNWSIKPGGAFRPGARRSHRHGPIRPFRSTSAMLWRRPRRRRTPWGSCRSSRLR